MATRFSAAFFLRWPIIFYSRFYRTWVNVWYGNYLIKMPWFDFRLAKNGAWLKFNIV